MLHHVIPGGGSEEGFAPNSGLEITPEFLDQVLTMLQMRGFDLVNFDEAVNRIEDGGRPFAAFTLDDGYRDNLVHAQPVFQRHDCPYTVFVAPAISDGTCELWWRGLEAAIAGNTGLTVEIGGETLVLDTSTTERKHEAWKRLYWPVRTLEQHQQRVWIREFCNTHGVNLQKICADAAMTWDEIRTLAADPLCTIGAHTINHFNVKALPAEEALEEMTASIDIIARHTGKRPDYFAYPYGDETSAGPREFELARAAGFRAAVTTRKGMIFPAHRDHLTALPRFSLSGHFQNMRYVNTLMSGVPFALFNGLRTVNVG